MKKHYLRLLFDTVFCGISVFVLSFLIFNYFADRKYTLIISAVLSFLGTVACYLLLRKKINSDFKTAEEKKEYEYFILTLKSISKESLNSFVYSLTEKDNLYISFSFSAFNKDGFIEHYNKYGSATVVTDCDEKELTEFFSHFNDVAVISGRELFKKHKAENAVLPQSPYIEKKQKLKLFDFKKIKAKKYFSVGLLLGFLSFFTPYKLYYVIVASLLLVLSVYCLMFGKENA